MDVCRQLFARFYKGRFHGCVRLLLQYDVIPFPAPDFPVQPFPVLMPWIRPVRQLFIIIGEPLNGYFALCLFRHLLQVTDRTVSRTVCQAVPHHKDAYLL